MAPVTSCLTVIRVIGGLGVVHGFGVVDGFRVIHGFGGRMVWLRGGVVDGFGSWVIGFGSRGMIRLGGRVVRSWLVGIVVSLTFVSDVSNVTIFMVSVISDDLSAAVGKSNAVFTSNNTILILGFLLVEVSTGVFVLDSVFIGEWARGDFVRVVVMHRFVWSRCRWVVRGWVIRSWVVGVVSQDNTQGDHGQDEDAKHF